MKFTLSLIVSALIVTTLSFTCGVAQNALELEGQQALRSRHQWPFRARRSLCNTFGGCGAKRSINSDRLSTLERNGDLDEFDREASLIQRQKETNAILVAEILNDLVEYLQTSEGNRRRKRVAMTSTKHNANANAEAMLANEGDFQEATGRLIRAYSRLDE